MNVVYAPRALRDLEGIAAYLIERNPAGAAKVLGAIKSSIDTLSFFPLIGRLVDGLQMALVLVLAPCGRDVGVPALGHAPARELHVTLVERRLELQQEQMLLDVEDRGGHDHETLASLEATVPLRQPPPTMLDDNQYVRARGINEQVVAAVAVPIRHAQLAPPAAAGPAIVKP